VGANPAVQIQGEKEQAARINYFVGNTREKWHTNIPTYGEIVYRDLYPGIDLRYAGQSGILKYAFTLQPGAKATNIRLVYRGAERLHLA
jgi:hypothetical protein